MPSYNKFIVNYFGHGFPCSMSNYKKITKLQDVYVLKLYNIRPWSILSHQAQRCQLTRQSLHRFAYLSVSGQVLLRLLIFYSIFTSEVLYNS